MPNETNHTVPHELKLENRSRLQLSGVQEVESFDEASVVLHTAQGLLVIRGEGLHLRTLSMDGGQVAVTGSIDSLTYEAPGSSGGFFKRIFG